MSSPQTAEETTDWTISDDEIDHLVCECQFGEQDQALRNPVITMCGRKEYDAMVSSDAPDGITCPMCWSVGTCPVCEE